MRVLKSLPIDEILKRGSITDTDVAMLKRAYAEDGHLGAEEADTLLIINDVCHSRHQGWTAIFVEMLSDYIVHQARPEGYLTVGNAVWLVSRTATEGRVKTTTELDLLIGALGKARWAPLSLVCFALEQVRMAVAEGKGPLREGATASAGTVTSKDIEVVRRLLGVLGNNIPITGAEASALLDINDAAAAGPANQAWTGLFVGAVTNAVMSASGYTVPPRTKALAYLADGKSIDAAAAGYQEQSGEEKALERLEVQRVEIITSEKIPALSVDWLAGRLGRNGAPNATEHALLLHLTQLGTGLHPALQTLLTRFPCAA